MSSLVTSLDIGSSQIKGIVAVPKKDGTLAVVTTIKRPSVGFKRGVLHDTEDATAALREVVLDLQRISKRAADNVIVNVNSEHVWVRGSQGMVAVARADQEIQQDDVDRAIAAAKAGKTLQNRVVMHNIVRDYLVDGVGDIADPVGMSGSRLEVNTFIVEAFAPHLNILLKTLDRVGLSVTKAVFNPLAAEKATVTKHRRELGTVMIDFGFGTTTLAVYEDGRIVHAKSLPVGAGHITNDIVAGLTVPFEVAEKLKIAYGYAMSKEIGRRDTINLSDVDPRNDAEVPKKLLCEIIEARLEEIMGLVAKEIAAIGRPLQFPGGVVITGGGAKMPGMVEFVKRSLRFPTQVVFPDLKGVEITNPAHQEILEDPEFSVAAGLLLWNGAEGQKPAGDPMGRVKALLKNLMP